MAGAAANVELAMARLGGPRRPYACVNTRASMCTRKNSGVRRVQGRCPRAREADAGWRHGAPVRGGASPGGVARVTGAGKGSRVHENACVGSRMTWRSCHRANRHHGGRRLGSPRQNAGELSSVVGNER
jgi:hypothetical protein